MGSVNTGNAFRGRALGAALLVLAMTGAAHAADSSPPAGAQSLKQARAAWDRGSLDAAEPLYRDALEKGGLAPGEVLEGYVRLGSIRAASGKKDSALAAFRAASVLDSSFVVPAEAGAKGARIADKAKRDTAKIGSIHLTVQVPKEVAAGKAFKVNATIDRGHLRMLRKVTLVAKDGTTAKDLALDASPEETIEFDIGPELTLPGASISVRIDAVDAHDNRLASAEERVRVPEGAPVAAAAPAAAGAGKSSASRGDSGVFSTTMAPAPGADSAARAGGSFWSSPWPYIIGGIALAGAGTAVYFGTRPSDTVTIGNVGVRPQ